MTQIHHSMFGRAGSLQRRLPRHTPRAHHVLALRRACVAAVRLGWHTGGALRPAAQGERQVVRSAHVPGPSCERVRALAWLCPHHAWLCASALLRAHHSTTQAGLELEWVYGYDGRSSSAANAYYNAQVASRAARRGRCAATPVCVPGQATICHGACHANPPRPHLSGLRCLPGRARGGGV